MGWHFGYSPWRSGSIGGTGKRVLVYRAYTTEAFWSPETLLEGILVSDRGRGGPSRLDGRGWHFGLHLAFCYFDVAAGMDGSSTWSWIWCSPLLVCVVPSHGGGPGRVDAMCRGTTGPTKHVSGRGGMVGGPYRNGCLSHGQEMDDDRQSNGVEPCLIPLHGAISMVIAVTLLLLMILLTPPLAGVPAKCIIDTVGHPFLII